MPAVLDPRGRGADVPDQAVLFGLGEQVTLPLSGQFQADVGVQEHGLQARVLAALATWRMLLGELDAAQPLAVRAAAIAQRAGADAERAHGLATLGVVTALQGDLDGGLSELRSAFTLAVRAGSVQDTIRAAANRVHLLNRAGRFAEAVEAGHAGRSAVAGMGAPPAITTGIGNNAASALLASGRWAEADEPQSGCR